MLRRVFVAISVGLADSLDPGTIGPALYLAAGPRRVRRLAEFTVAVFLVDFLVGVILTIGPGRALLGLIPRPHKTLLHVIELVAGVALLVGAVIIWKGRRRLARHKLPTGRDGSAFLTGATVAVVQLPAAAAYFAVIAAIVASDASVPEELGLLIIYNLAFVAPLLGIIGVLLVAGDHAGPWLDRGAAWLQRRWPGVLAGVLLFAGGVLLLLGGTGLVKT